MKLIHGSVGLGLGLMLIGNSPAFAHFANSGDPCGSCQPHGAQTGGQCKSAGSVHFNCTHDFELLEIYPKVWYHEWNRSFTCTNTACNAATKPSGGSDCGPGEYRSGYSGSQWITNQSHNSGGGHFLYAVGNATCD